MSQYVDIELYYVTLSDTWEDKTHLTRRADCILMNVFGFGTYGKLGTAQEKTVSLKEEYETYCVLLNQGKVLSTYADSINEKGMLKVVALWQNKIIYLLYVVFILNAFITL